MTERRCICCRQSRAKGELLRLVCDNQGSVWPDLPQKAPGRGAYVCWGTCLERLRDKALRAAWKGRAKGANLADELRQRLAVALWERCRQYVRPRKRSLCIGRDAVMRRLWQDAPVLVLLADDAGEALKRQIGDACARRSRAGRDVELHDAGPAAALARLLDREKVSVLAMDAVPASKKWLRDWKQYARLME